ncbi:MAG: alpha/beta hydrolase [Kordiimonadaceae bacterium]|nr:alpha/beta hydrolase [Kordiimonadaceae bacterium]
MRKLLIGMPVILVAIMVWAYFFLPATMLSYTTQAEREAAGLEVKSITVGSHDIRYLEGGEGEILLLIHGFGANKDAWVDFSKHLIKSYHIIALDLPGWAKSQYHETENYGVTAQVKRLKEIVTALGVEKYHVVGSSMGGWISGVLAHADADRVLSLGLVDNAGITPPNKNEFFTALEQGNNMLDVKSAEDIDRVLSLVFYNPPEIPKFIKPYLAKKSIERQPMNSKIMQDLMADPVPLEPLLPDLNMPTFIIWGKNDRLIDVSAVDVMEPLLKNSTIVILENTGHVPMREKPEIMADHYRAFLKSAAMERAASDKVALESAKLATAAE